MKTPITSIPPPNSTLQSFKVWSRETGMTSALLISLLLIIFGSVLFSDRTLLPSDLVDTLTLPYAPDFGTPHASNQFVSDGILQFLPYKKLLRDSWQSGKPAFWNPLNLCGYPQFAETMATNFDPLNLIFLVFPLLLGFHLYMLAPLFLAGIGFYALIRLYQVDPWVARLFCASYMLCGLFFTHLLPHFIPGSFCWVPWICFALRKHSSSGSLSSLLWAATWTACAFLGGNIQTAAFVVVVVATYSWGVSLEFGRGYIPTSRMLVFSLGVGLALSAVMWLPTLELFIEVVRHGALASTSYARPYTAIQRLLTLPLLLTFFLPELGSVHNGFSLYNIIGAFTIDFNAAFGCIPMLAGIFTAIRYRKDQQVLPFALLALFAFAIPIATPLYHYFYHRFFIVAIFGLCAAGAIGFQKWLQKDVLAKNLDRWIRIAYRTTLFIAAILILESICVWLFYDSIFTRLSTALLPRAEGTAFSSGNSQWLIDRVRNTIHHVTLASVPLALAVLSILLSLYIMRRAQSDGRPITSKTLITLFVLNFVQLASFAIDWLPDVRLAQYPLYPPTALTSQLQSDTTDSRIYFDRRLQANQRYLLIDNMNVMYGLSTISGFESLIPRSFYLQIPLHFSDTDACASVLGSLAVSRLVSTSTTFADTNFVRIGDEYPPVYANKRALPRIRLASGARRMDNDSIILKTLFESGFDYGIALISTADWNRELDTYLQPDSSITNERVTWKQPNPESLIIQSETARPRLLIVSDTYYPGWTAAIDDSVAHINRANYAMRAIAIPAGKHLIHLQYDPLSFRVGLTVSLICGMLLLLIGLWQYRRDRVVS